MLIKSKPFGSLDAGMITDYNMSVEVSQTITTD